MDESIKVQQEGILGAAMLLVWHKEAPMLCRDAPDLISIVGTGLVGKDDNQFFPK